MASNAVLSEHHARDTVRQAPVAIAQYFATHPRVVTRRHEPDATIDLDLRSGIKIVYRAGHQGEPLTRLLALADAIKEYEALPVGWDSYDAAALNDKAVYPTLELAIYALHRCQHPTVLPLPNGGLGLRFQTEAKELEIDVGPDGRCTALLEDVTTGEMHEVANPQEASVITSLINIYCRTD